MQNMQSNYIDGIEQPKFSIKYLQRVPNKNNNTHEQSLKQSLNIRKTPENKEQIYKRYSQHHQRYRSIDTSEVQTGRYHQQETNEKYQCLRKRSVNLTEKQSENSLLGDKKEFQKIPIQFSDETPWSGLKGRLVYRGYSPRNSYYMMAKLRQCDQNIEAQVHSKVGFESDLQFNSKFESGNLQASLRVSKKEYWLFMREDTNTLGLRQWFFFEVVSNHPLDVTFRIYKFTKKYSLYRQEMKPYIKEYNEQWAQKGQNVSYNYDEEMKCYYLSFSFKFTKERERILVAGMPPYTYSRLIRYLGQLSELVRIRYIAKSLGGVDIPLIQIPSVSHSQTTKKGKKAIIMIGRTHPAQTCSNYSFETIISAILGSPELRSEFDFFIVPMVNPDGVIAGNHRTGLSGMDLNRKFTFNLKQSQKQMFPEVEAVKQLVKEINRTHRIQFFLDLHGHSAKNNIFSYGQKEVINSDHYLKSRIIPKLLGDHLAAFKYDHCVFQSYRQKKTTARVYFGKKYKVTTITFQQSYGRLDHCLISIGDWKSFGTELIAVLHEYMASYMQNNDEMSSKLRKQIEQDTQKEVKKETEKLVLRRSLQEQSVAETEEKYIKRDKIHEKKSVFPFQPKEEDQQQDSISESLESGDEELENTEEGLQQLRAKMFVVRQQSQRQSMNLPDTSIQLDQITRPRVSILHEQKMPVVSRILRMQEKRRKSGDLINILTQNTIKEQLKSMRLKIRQHKIKLPNIIKFTS